MLQSSFTFFSSNPPESTYKLIETSTLFFKFKDHQKTFFLQVSWNLFTIQINHCFEWKMYCLSSFFFGIFLSFCSNCMNRSREYFSFFFCLWILICLRSGIDKRVNADNTIIIAINWISWRCFIRQHRLSRAIYVIIKSVDYRLLRQLIKFSSIFHLLWDKIIFTFNTSNTFLRWC